jgi:hypothetical protein
MLVTSQVSVRRPWKRTSARSGDVVAVRAGTLDLKPCGPSTRTSGIFRSPRKASVRSMFFSLNHVALRNSTAPSRPAFRSWSTASSMVSRFSDEVKNHRGYWSRIEPSWPASLSGSSPSANRAQTSSRTSSGRSLA